MLTAQELIYKAMINECIKNNKDLECSVINYDGRGSYCDLWYHLKEIYDICYEIEYEFREGMETNLHPKTSSRHYEIDVCAMKCDGVWVAWDYYYGGGKHGEPEAFDWISNARIVKCTEKEVTEIEYTFEEL